MLGSSPLARGTPPDSPVYLSVDGLIPARAGTTAVAIVKDSRNGAHPRSRREHRHSAALPRCDPGSSPLTRGTRQYLGYRQYAPRLIPARAGNIAPLLVNAAATWAHPRSHGEHVGSMPRDVNDLGSSPLARGTLHRYSVTVLVAMHWNPAALSTSSRICHH